MRLSCPSSHSPLLLLLSLVLLSVLPSSYSQSQCSYSNVTSVDFGHLFQGVTYGLSAPNLLQLTNLSIPYYLVSQGGYVTSLSVNIASFATSGSFRLALYRQSPPDYTPTLLTQSAVATFPGNTSLQIVSIPVPPTYLPPNPGPVLVAVWFADPYLAVATDQSGTGTLGTATTAYNYTATGAFPATVTDGLNPINLLRFNYQVAYTLAQGTGCSFGVAGRVQGDPQFQGFLGQSYQVHGVDGYVYNLISTHTLQVNSRFVFLNSGRCPVLDGVPQDNCWSHPGSYLGEIGLMVKVDGKVHRMEVVSGDHKQGFAAVYVDGAALGVGATGSIVSATEVVTYEYVDSHEVRIGTPTFSFTFYNSDRFINQQVVVHVPVASLTSHGLLGQSHTQRGRQVVEGDVDDYVLTEDDVFGTDFRYNQFEL